MTEREKEVLDKTINIIKESLNPNKVIMFGSRGKGRSKFYSDFGLAIDIKRPDIRTRRIVEDKIDDAIGLYSVDLVYLNSVDENFRNWVLKEGKIVYEKWFQGCN